MPIRSGAEMQADMATLATNLKNLEKRVADGEKVRDDMDGRNHRSIEDLRESMRNQIERLGDKFSDSIEKMATKISDSIDRAIKPVADQQKSHDTQIRKLEIQWAKAMGWVLGGAAMSGFIFKLAEYGLGHLLPK